MTFWTRGHAAVSDRPYAFSNDSNGEIRATVGVVAEAEKMNIDEYRRLVEHVMQGALVEHAPMARTFENLGTEHASVVIDVMTKNAKSNLSVYTHEMVGNVWNRELV